jgi:glycosyltransferase involved in cell wall biosynthesis
MNDSTMQTGPGPNAQPRRVLVVTPFIWEAGPYHGKATIYYILRGFLRAGYEVHVVTATSRRGETDAVWEGLNIHYFRVPLGAVDFEYDAFHSFLSLVRRQKAGWRRHLTFRLFWLQFVWLSYRRALQVARLWPPTITYGVNNPGIPAAYGVARRLGVPNFSRIMGSPIVQWAGSRVKLYLARFDELLAFRLPASALIVTDDGTISADEIEQELGIPRARIWLLRNGIDKTSFTAGPERRRSRMELGISPESKVLLSVSQLVDWKRVDRVIGAMPAVVARCPEARLLIVGDGPERANLEAQAKRLDVAHLVRFEGFVAREALPRYFQSSDVFTAFYNYANVGNSMLEAMLTGNAVVTLNNGHTGDLVKHMSNGFMVEPDRLSDIPDALIQVLTDDDLRRKLGGSAAAWANATLLTWDERIEQEIAMIEATVLAGTPGGPATSGQGAQ